MSHSPNSARRHGARRLRRILHQSCAPVGLGAWFAPSTEATLLAEVPTPSLAASIAGDGAMGCIWDWAMTRESIAQCARFQDEAWILN